MIPLGVMVASSERMKRNDVRIATPCTLDWKKMTPADGGRFCGDCKKVVRNLSSMTEREARALLKNAGDGELCVRFVYDDQGRIFFGKDAPRRDLLLPASLLLLRARRVAAAAAIGALPFATQACEAVTSPLGITSEPQHAHDDNPNEMMGGVSLDPDSPQLMQGDAGDGADAKADAEVDAERSDAGDVDADTDAGPNEPPPIY